MLKIFRSRKISGKMGIPITLITILISAVVYLLVSRLTGDIIRDNLNIVIRIKINSLQQSIKNETKKNLEIASLFSYHKNVINAYKTAYSGNIHNENSPQSQTAREMLRETFRSYMKGWTENTGKKFELHFHLPPARSLVRLWRKKQTRKNGKWIDISDDLTAFRRSILDISSGKTKQVAGLEIGSGGFVVRGITGVYNENGKLIGSVESLSDFNSILQKTKDSNNEEFNAYMNSDFLPIATQLQNSIRHPLVGNNFVEVASTSSHFMRHLIDPVLLHKARKSPVTVIKNDYSISYFPFLDYSQKQIGIGVFFRNITVYKKKVFYLHFFILMALVIVAAINLLVIHFTVKKIIAKPLNRLKDIISQNSMGNLTVYYPLTDVNCSEMMNCHKENCPLFGKNHSLCFLDVGSFAPQFGKSIICPSILSGKFKTCSECPVYNKVVKDEIEHIAVWYTKLIENLSEIILNIRNKGRIIQERVVSLSSSITQTSATMEELSTATSTIGETTDSQKEMVDEALKSINQIVSNIDHSNKSIETQSVSIEKFSATIEELTASIMSVANVSEEARNISVKLNNAAQNGNTAIHQVIDAVSGIEKFSKTINDILSVISNIAEQTNLLAMNAAIEAAHAGEYGKGFAVVADEIRKLAESSSYSSKEIQKLVKDIMKLIKNAAELGVNAEAGLGEIIDDVNNANKINLEVYNSAREQTTGVNDILTSISHILSGINDIRSSMNHINQDSKRILSFIANVKTMSFMVAGATKEQADGSNGILSSILEQTESVQNIKDSMNELYSIIEKFNISENNSSGLTIRL